jgi:hypothetical protein
MLTIPLQPVPSQTLAVLLAGQNCKLAVYQKTTGLYIDLSINDVPVVTAVICRDRARIVRQPYRGFVGELSFSDLLGTSDPDYTQLGSRFALVYLQVADLS